MRVFTTIVFFVNIICALGRYIHFEKCEHPIFTPDSVSVAPYYPQIGKDLLVRIRGNTKQTIKKGTFSYELFIEVQFRGVPVTTKVASGTEDLCDYAECPIKPGFVVISYVRYLPKELLAGNYKLKIRAKTDDDKQLMCIIAPLKLVRPPTDSKLQGFTQTEIPFQNPHAVFV